WQTGSANRKSSAVSQCGRENDLFAPPPQGRGRTPVRVQSARTNLRLYAARAAKSRQDGCGQVDAYGYTSKAVVGRLSCLLCDSPRTWKNAWICSPREPGAPGISMSGKQSCATSMTSKTITSQGGASAEKLRV